MERSRKKPSVFVFADGWDWAGDQQIILDLYMGKNGRLGTRSETFGGDSLLFFVHNGVIWFMDRSFSRIGMGTLRGSGDAMFKAITGKELQTVAFGKPQPGTFNIATRLLRQWRTDPHGVGQPPYTISFVGNTSDSGIRSTTNLTSLAKRTTSGPRSSSALASPSSVPSPCTSLR
jgi:hypothetical protein